MHAKSLIAAAGAFVAVALLLLPSLALAQSTSSPTTVGDIDKIQSQIYRQKALLSLATVNAELAKKGGAQDGVSADGAPPNCNEVYGTPGDYKVVFLYSDGSQVIGRQGDTIPGGWRVGTVALDQVRVSRDGKTRDCGFSATAPSLHSQSNLAPTGFMAPPPVPSPSSAAEQ